jgi:hypothetical protein
MKRTALTFFGRIFYSNKIKNYEIKYIEIYKEDWNKKPWEDYAKDCIKVETELKENILNIKGSQRLEYLCGLQALYNIREKELNYIEEQIQKIPNTELKRLFETEYESILNNLNGIDLNSAMKLYSKYGNIANSKEIQKNYSWKYVSACLAICAIEEVFGSEINDIERNINAL